MKYPAENNDYYRNYNLVRDPFPLNITDQVLYLTPEINHRLELLAQRVANDTPVQVVISPSGGGKTVIAEYLASLKEPDWLTGLVRADPNMDGEALSLALLKKYFPDGDIEREQAVDRLRQLLESSNLNGKMPVFLIDDAHLLSQDCLQYVLQLAGESCCRAILFANETINDLFDKPGLNEFTKDRLKQLNLPPLSPDQTRAYLDNRISLSGEVNDYPFSDDELQRIARISAGLPGGINLLARQFMQQKIASGTGGRTGSGRLLIVAGSTVILLAGAYYYFTNRPISTAGSATVVTTSVKQQPHATQPPVKKEQGGPAEKSITNQQLFNAQVSLKLPSTTTVAADTKTTKQQPYMSDKPQPAEETPAHTPATTEPQTAAQAPSEPEQDSSNTGTSEQAGNEETAPVAPVKMADDNVYRLDPVPAVVQGIKGPIWLRQQSPDLYVLQILSVSEFSNLAGMLKKIPEMQGQLSGYTNYTPSGKARYLLYYGLYPDRATAYAAINNIPTPLQAIKPWPRSLKSILDQLDELQARGYY